MTGVTAWATGAEASKTHGDSEGFASLLRTIAPLGACAVKIAIRGVRMESPDGGAAPNPLFDLVDGFCAAVISNPEPLVRIIHTLVTGAPVWVPNYAPSATVPSLTFETAFGSAPTEGWSFKWSGAGPPPPPVDLAFEANPFIPCLSPLMLVGAGE